MVHFNAKYHRSDCSVLSTNEIRQLLLLFCFSWIGPLMPLGAALAGPVAGILVNRIGRRKTMMWLTVPFFVGCVLMGVCYPLDNIYVLYAGRLLAGTLEFFSTSTQKFLVIFVLV